MSLEKRRTKILELGLSEKAVSFFDESLFEIFRGSYGHRIDCRRFTECGRLNYSVPDNIHEYDILVVSFDEIETEENYYPRDNYLSSQDVSISFFCSAPATLFDPVPFVCSQVLYKNFYKKNNPALEIIFVSHYVNDETIYHYHERNNAGTTTRSFPINSNEVLLCYSSEKVGMSIGISERIPESLCSTLKKFLPHFKYYRVLYNNKDSDLPILENQDGEAVGIIRFKDKHITIILPEMDDYDIKGNLIIDLINNVFVDIIPGVFPLIKNKKWLENDRFKTKEEIALRSEIDSLELEFNRQKEEIERKIEKTKEERKFFLDMISTDSDILVTSVVNYLKWLGFDDVKNCDETEKKKEEDINITIGQDQILIEVKGITNLPQERDCNQIDKIVMRRKRPGYQGLIHPVFIVNHEKNLDPVKRSGEVFTNQEIEDAIGMSRSLITTWDMYQAFERIEAGFLTKSYVRECFWKDGLVTFEYPEKLKIGTVSRVFHDGLVGVVNVNEISIGDDLVYIRDNDWKRITVVNVKNGDDNITSARNIEVSIEFDSSVKKGGVIYKVMGNEGNDNA